MAKAKTDFKSIAQTIVGAYQLLQSTDEIPKMIEDFIIEDLQTTRAVYDTFHLELDSYRYGEKYEIRRVSNHRRRTVTTYDVRSVDVMDRCIRSLYKTTKEKLKEYTDRQEVKRLSDIRAKKVEKYAKSLNTMFPITDIDQSSFYIELVPAPTHYSSSTHIAVIVNWNPDKTEITGSRVKINLGGISVKGDVSVDEALALYAKYCI